MRRIVLALLLVCATVAQADTRALVVATDPPGETITLGRDEVLWVRIAYTTDEPVRLWARPFFRGSEVTLPGTRSNPSIVHTGAGYALGWFSLRAAAEVDEVRILAGTAGSPESREIARHAVRLTASGAPATPRQAAEWVGELRRETEAASRIQREQARQGSGGIGDTLLEIVIMAVIGAVVLGVPALVLWGLWRWRHGTPDDEPVERLPYIAAGLTGLIVCLAIALATGRKEAWDSGLYYSFGIPVMVLAIFVISYRYPQRAWRWTLAMAVGQAAAMLAGGNSLSLWPLAIIAMLVVSVPQFVAGFVASRLALRNAA